MVEIRKAIASEAEAILNYCKVVGAESDDLTFGAEGVSIAIEEEREYLESILHSNKQLYLVAADGSEIVDTAVFSSFTKARLAHRAEISISVRKSMWGNHIGTRFMEKIIDFAKNTAGTEIISLEVRSNNERAIALYQKFGFQKIGTFDSFMKIGGNYVSCDIMTLSLTKNPVGITIVEWEDRFAQDFITLSIEWLEKYVRVEAADEEILYHPHESILNDGGMIFFANSEGVNVGTVSMIKLDGNIFELAKLAVIESCKGKHIGNMLMERSISFAKEKGADIIILFTNSKLLPAIRLYEKYGFQRIPLIDNEYEEADIKMELRI